MLLRPLRRPTGFRLKRLLWKRLIGLLGRDMRSAMIQFFDMDDRARLPWRFHGQSRTVTAQL